MPIIVQETLMQQNSDVAGKGHLRCEVAMNSTHCPDAACVVIQAAAGASWPGMQTTVEWQRLLLKRPALLQHMQLRRPPTRCCLVHVLQRCRSAHPDLARTCR